MSAIDGTAGDVVYLVSCVLAGKTPDEGRIAAMDLDEVYHVSQRHVLGSACAMALESAGVRDERFVQAQAKAVRKVALMDAERIELFRRMDAAGIWHVPLKGSVLKALYPAYGMREMADNDILFDESRAEDVRDIMQQMGFTCERFGYSNHDKYHKEPVCNFEMHRSLFSPLHESALRTYYQDPLRLLIPDGDDTYGMHFSDEDFYVYMIAHEYKHFAAGGTGLRSLADTYVWVTTKGMDQDWEYVLYQLYELGLMDFEEQNRNLAFELFSGLNSSSSSALGADLSDESAEMFEYMANSGAYGTVGHNAANQVARYGRTGYLVRRAFPSPEVMTMLYPVLDRAPALLPACWAWRLVSALATKPRTVAIQLKAAFPGAR